MRTSMIYGLAAIAYLSSALSGSAEEVKSDGQTRRETLECNLQHREAQEKCTLDFNRAREESALVMDEIIRACLRDYNDAKPVDRQNCVNYAHNTTGREVTLAVEARANCLELATVEHDHCLGNDSGVKK